MQGFVWMLVGCRQLMTRCSGQAGRSCRWHLAALVWHCAEPLITPESFRAGAHYNQ